MIGNGVYSRRAILGGGREARAGERSRRSRPTRAPPDLQKKVQKLERRLQASRPRSTRRPSSSMLNNSRPTTTGCRRSRPPSPKRWRPSLEHEDERDDELLEAEQHLADLEGLHEELVERSAKSPVKASLSSSSDEAEPPAQRRATPSTPNASL